MKQPPDPLYKGNDDCLGGSPDLLSSTYPPIPFLYLYFISIISSLLVKTSSPYAILISYSIVEVLLDLLHPFIPSPLPAT